MSTALILPPASVDVTLRQRIRHALARRGISLKDAATAAGCNGSTMIRWTSLNPAYRRSLSADSIDQILAANGLDSDELLRPVLSDTLRDYLADVGGTAADLPLAGMALLAYRMGLLEVRGTEGEPSTYRLCLTNAGRRALI